MNQYQFFGREKMNKVEAYYRLFETGPGRRNGDGIVHFFRCNTSIMSFQAA